MARGSTEANDVRPLSARANGVAPNYLFREPRTDTGAVMPKPTLPACT